MTGRLGNKVLVGGAALRAARGAGTGAWVDRDGERFYRIAGYDRMPPFLMSVVSGHDHWLFVSSTGGLTCGRRDPGNALFPYCTDDKLHDASATTGPLTLLLVDRDDASILWQPFDRGPRLHDVERNLYRNVAGNKLVFEEINRDLELAFSSAWTTGNRFGFVRRSRLANLGAGETRVRLLDGVRNLLPYGVDRAAQSELSTLIDAYKRAEAVPDACAGIYTLGSILTDRAEPNEALKATVVWSTGLDRSQVLLSEDQIESFREGLAIRDEATSAGKRGAFLVHANVSLEPGGERRWDLLADVERSQAQTVELLQTIRSGVPASAVDEDVAAGSRRLEALAGSADAFQCCADELVTGRHFANTLFNIMRGGVFPYAYEFPCEDFLYFAGERNRPLRGAIETALERHPGPLTLHAARRLADEMGDEHVARLVLEYLPLTFSRRHGDPSRPWNHFSITLRNGHGAEYLNYEGNWRDIFQNWEALALSFPDYVESFIAKFVNASTADGHNAYRISRAGIDWEVLDPANSWSNIGYWGDHQVGYLVRLLELSRACHPGLLDRWLSRRLFVYADVPYRIKAYAELLRDPRNTVEYDEERACAVARRVDEIGADGKLVVLADGTIHRVNLLEKLLVSALARLGNLAPGGGIWMNTQRPEWNDANNALVGYGLSMVTLCYLRRFLLVLGELVRESGTASFDVSREVARLLADVCGVLDGHRDLLDGPVAPAGRASFMDAMGPIVDAYRAAVYRGLDGETAPVTGEEIDALVSLAIRYLDHSIAHCRRDDGLFHSYNLARFDADGYDVEPLDEMLEGQVAVLSSGFLDGEAAADLLEALRASRLYRPDQNSYLLYPDKTLPSFLEKNVIPRSIVEADAWIRRQLEAGRTDYVERDGDGRVRFNGVFRNVACLRAALERDPDIDAADAARLCETYEDVFAHRKFTGRSGTMVKYEGLGCIYWHMVSKLALATGETIASVARDDVDPAVLDRLMARFRDIRAGLGVHKSPAEYGAFPLDPYSHTPAFGGVQQPGLTGQVKEDLITRFCQLGVRMERGEVAFRPVMLARDEFLRNATLWRFSTGGPARTERLAAGSLGFTLCGVPVVYRIAPAARVQVVGPDGSPIVIDGDSLGPELSRSLFARDGRIRSLTVDVPEAALA